MKLLEFTEICARQPDDGYFLEKENATLA